MNTTPGLGHNFGQVPTPSDIAAYLAETHADLARRQEEILAGLDRMPETICDDDTNAKATDFVKAMQQFVKASEAKRVDFKQPYLDGGKAVDGFFAKLVGPVAAAKKTVEGRMTVFGRAKAEAERKAREEAARRAAEEAERQRREAEAAAQAIQDAASLDSAIGAEKAAETAAGDAAAAQRAAAAKAADLSRTRGDLGGVSSLRTFWDFRDLDRATIDLEVLRDHLPIDGIEKAVRSFIQAGGREIRGAHIFENSKTVVR